MRPCWQHKRRSVFLKIVMRRDVIHALHGNQFRRLVLTGQPSRSSCLSDPPVDRNRRIETKRKSWTANGWASTLPRTSTSRPTGDTRSYAGGQTYAGVDGETILEMVTSEMLHWVKHGDGRTETGFGEPGEPGDPLVPVRQGQGLCTDLLIQPEETQRPKPWCGGCRRVALIRPESPPARNPATPCSGGPA